ncbi:MAG: BMP family ABC transporter substrate-binding protein [Collinsella sp.]
METFTDAAKGKAAGQKMYSDGCDIVFACAGNAGNGVIEAAQDADKMVIGVDKDQYDLAPENMLTSVMKNVDKAVIEVSTMASNGEKVGGKNIELSAKDGAVAVSTHHDLMEPGGTTPPSSCSTRSRTARSSPRDRGCVQRLRRFALNV